MTDFSLFDDRKPLTIAVSWIRVIPLQIIDGKLVNPREISSVLGSAWMFQSDHYQKLVATISRQFLQPVKLLNVNDINGGGGSENRVGANLH